MGLNSDGVDLKIMKLESSFIDISILGFRKCLEQLYISFWSGEKFPIANIEFWEKCNSFIVREDPRQVTKRKLYLSPALTL